MRIAPCRTYHAKTAGTSLLRMPDGRSVFKVYYVSVVGRDEPALFEWQHSRCSPVEFETAFMSGAHEGIGFVIAFPHVTKIYRFSPAGETILDVKEFDTPGMVPRDCSRADGYHEFACYAEAVLAADEYRFWAAAATVDDYLACRSHASEFPVVSNVKLSAWWNLDAH
jgi:hypothetical protein